MNWDLILRFGGVLGGLSTLIILPWQIRRVRAVTKKHSADVTEVLVDKALSMLEPAEDIIDRLEARLGKADQRATELEAELKASKADVQDLREQVAVLTKEVVALRVENEALRGGVR